MKKISNKNRIYPQINIEINDKDSKYKKGKRFARIMTILTVGIIFAIAICI